MLNLGLGAGSSRYMLSYFGVPEGSPAGLGLADTLALDPHWVLDMGLNLGCLLGPAAASPLTEQPGHFSLGLSLGYRR